MVARSVSSTARAPRFPWLDAMRGLAILMIVLYHITIPIYGIPWFAHPRNDWPDLEARLAQIRPLPQENLLSFLLANLFRYIGWLGYQGTGVFLVVSGFGLTWALASRSREAEIDRRAFYLRRFLRLFPLYWVGHFFFLVFHNVVGWRPFSPLDPRFVLSLAGFRFLPEVFHFISPAWWFIVLIMQLYAVFPFLWMALQRLGLLRFWVGAALLTAISRGIGFFLLPVDWEMWSRGLFFPSRLAEFALGMGLAWWAAGETRRMEDLIRSPRAWAGLLALYGIGLSLSFTLPGAVVAPMLVTPAATGFLMLLAWGLLPRLRWLYRGVSALGAYSYGVMIFHQPILWAFIAWLWPFTMPLTLRLSLIGVVAVLVFLGSAAIERGTYWMLQQRPLNQVFPQPGPYALPPARTGHFPS
ncbi:acyltransferase [Thermoflexus sp.]|uniref:acyltransferase family protein n=1 Tax=Thermoflexus sp. TaxID=1969742 RepID=UPI002ADE1824|nr:acyltransferase [Thermoflexus sp.]